MNTRENRVEMRKREFLSMMEREVVLWSDARLENTRSNIFTRWCFDTGDPGDLIYFKLLDSELQFRKHWKPTIKTDADQ